MVMCNISICIEAGAFTISLVFLQARDANIDDIVVLFKSKDFVAVDKHYDVIVYPPKLDQTSEISVENQLRKLFPDDVDDDIPFGFR